MGRTLLRFAALSLCAVVSGCQTARELPAAPAAQLDPIAFFSGQSEGHGQLKKLFSSPVAVEVRSFGRAEGGTLVLDQIIQEGSNSPRVRRWTMTRIGPDRFTGTLTDAAGPVQVDVTGPRARIRYTMKNGLGVDQQLALQRDGVTILNRLQVTKLGLRVAVLNETIRKLR